MKQLTLRFPAACARCGKRLNRGAVAWWKPGHVECCACFTGLERTTATRATIAPPVAPPVVAPPVAPPVVAPRRAPKVTQYQYQHCAFGRTKRDTQRSKAYQWERETAWALPGNLKLTLDQCQALADAALALFGKASIPVKHTQRNRGRCTGGYEIHLPTWAHTRVYTLHEAAHAIAFEGPDFHGPHFVRVLSFLLDHFGIATEEHMTTRAARYGLKVAAREHVIKPV